jgi:peroxiredoxin
MINRIKVSLVILFIFSLATYVLANEPEPAPGFKLQDIRQDMVTLSSYKDEQAVLLFFWTTWCPFCQRELRVLNSMYAGLVKDGLEVLSINSGETPNKVEAFVRSYFLAYRVLLDKDTAVTRSYKILGVPTYILIDKKGNIVFRDNFFPYKDYKDLISKPENPK